MTPHGSSPTFELNNKSNIFNEKQSINTETTNQHRVKSITSGNENSSQGGKGIVHMTFNMPVLKSNKISPRRTSRINSDDNTITG